MLQKNAFPPPNVYTTDTHTDCVSMSVVKEYYEIFVLHHCEYKCDSYSSDRSTTPNIYYVIISGIQIVFRVSTKRSVNGPYLQQKQKIHLVT